MSFTDEDKIWMTTAISNSVNASERRMIAAIGNSVNASEPRMMAAIGNSVNASETRMTGAIEKVETALFTEFHKWASPWICAQSLMRSRSEHSTLRWKPSTSGLPNLNRPTDT